MDDTVRALAEDAGISNDWTDAAGQPHRVAVGPLRAILAALGFPCSTVAELTESRERARVIAAKPRDFVTGTVDTLLSLAGFGADQDITAELALEDGTIKPVTLRASKGGYTAPPIDEPGYHRLRVFDREITLAVAPPRCITLEDVAAGKRMYGLAVQLYALRRAGDGGIGDTGALRDLVASAARNGADAIALSPVHSLFTAEPGHYGPYSPSSRLFLNPLYADPAIVLGEARVAAARGGNSDARPEDTLIDWPAARTKYAMLRRLFDDFSRERAQAASGPLAVDFGNFVREGGVRLREHALFEAGHQQYYHAESPVWSWRNWPAEWRTPASSGVARFADTNAREIEFHLFLQWVATRSFLSAQKAARDAGMRIGLIGDLAIGMSPDGSHAWSRQDDLLLGLSVGAPPDPFNTRGQDWGLTAFSPQALMSNGFEPFIATLRAAMRITGGVRIDHVMGLTRLWLVPRGGAPMDGAYLRYPLEDLLRIVALESHRHRAIVVGEDLGTVPPDFRARAAAAGISGMDVLWFQRNRRGFTSPNRWRRDAVAMTTTHDLPTAAGWWSGADIETRAAIGLAPDEDRELAERGRDRAAIWRAYRRAGILDGPQPQPDDTAPAVDAAIAFTARSPAPLALIPVEDILGLSAQPNLPGTIDEHPNWRQRLPASAGEMLDAPLVRRRLQTLRERP